MTQRKVLYLDPQKFLPKESSVEDELVGINTVPEEGLAGQVLKKNSNNSYDYSWKSISFTISIDLFDKRQEIDLSNQVNGYYSYKIINNSNQEVEIQVEENNNLFTIISLISMNGLRFIINAY